MKYKDYAENPHENKSMYIKIFIFLIFAGILIFIIYSSFYPNSFSKLITGNAVKDLNIKDSVEITAELNSPEKLETSGSIEKIEIKLKDPVNLYIGKETIELSSSTSIIIDNYQGDLFTESNTITKLEGKTTKVFINGLPLTAQTKTKISLDPAKFDYLKLNNFYLDSLSYTASGKISLNNKKVTLSLDNERISIDKFIGNLEIKKSSLSIKGYIDKSNIQKILDITSAKQNSS